MKLDVKAMAFTIGLVWGAAMFLTGVAYVISEGYGEAFLDVMASVYPGYDATSNFGDVIVGTLYGLVDGAVGGAVVAWLYNRLAGPWIWCGVGSLRHSWFGSAGWGALMFPLCYLGRVVSRCNSISRQKVRGNRHDVTEFGEDLVVADSGANHDGQIVALPDTW